MIRTNLLTETVTDLVSEGLAETDDDLLVVNPARETIRELVSTVQDTADAPGVRLLAAERPLKELMDDFLVASSAADLIAADLLEIRTLDDPPRNSLLVSQSAVASVVTAGENVAGLTTIDDDFVSGTRKHYDELWESAKRFSLRTPPLSRVRETLAHEIGDATASDFDEVLESLQHARGNGEGLDEVTISLLVAARNGELLYDISKWGEDVGLASKATFSRTKTRLEDNGLIDTEKVPIDVGRPRLRLMLGDVGLKEADIDELAAVAEEMLVT